VHVAFIAALAAAAAVGGYFAYTAANRPQYALEVDATRDTTDISGTLYRIRVVNTGSEQLTGIVAKLGEGDVQKKDLLEPGQAYYFYPDPDTMSPTITITTNEGIRVVTDYRTPTKVIGLPGAGR
jgi:hypothetical protein